MVQINNSNFSIEQIAESGQCFRLNKIKENKYVLIAFGKYLEIIQEQEEVIFSCTADEYNDIWRHYFDLNTDYNRFVESVFDADTYLYHAVQFGKGIRILKQDIWEILISFIISQQNNIKRIKKSIELLCERFGEKKYDMEGNVYFDFPSVQALAQAMQEELDACNLGYRSRYIASTANSILNQEVNIESVEQMDYEHAQKELLKLCGVGNKVADCICLFALHHLDAFPVDTHIKKVIESHYPKGFPLETFLGYAGVIQQYIFYYDLKNGI
ncbi:8-oxoguanine DNA glycosylase [Lachnospiraceae bacterium ZAX-1]